MAIALGCIMTITACWATELVSTISDDVVDNGTDLVSTAGEGPSDCVIHDGRNLSLRHGERACILHWISRGRRRILWSASKELELRRAV
jgi:hypothetical protein